MNRWQKFRRWSRWHEGEIALLLVSSPLLLFLVSCTPTPTGYVEQVQELTVKSCGFRPSAKTVEAIQAKGNEALNEPQTMAFAICQAVKAKPQ